jgi:site-specific recombinase XerD
MQVRNLSLYTQRAYIDQVSQFARYFGRSPATLGSEDIRTYQIYLANERRLASSSIQIAIAALRFLYRVTLKKESAFAEVLPSPKHRPSCPSSSAPMKSDGFSIASTASSIARSWTTCYGAGLRISEAVHLKTTDIDSRRMMIRVAQGKGQKDRYVQAARYAASLLARGPAEGLADRDRRPDDSALAWPSQPDDHRPHLRIAASAVCATRSPLDLPAPAVGASNNPAVPEHL